MSEPTLYDIPLEVFRDFLLPDLGAKEVASLSLVSRDLRDLCDDNEIWKILYSRTTKRVMITDKSVHTDATWHMFQSAGSRRCWDTPIYMSSDPNRWLPRFSCWQCSAIHSPPRIARGKIIKFLRPAPVARAHPDAKHGIG